MKHSENATQTCLEAFKKCFENTVLGSKIRFSAQMSNNAKKNHMKHPENTNSTCFEAFQEFLENLVLGSKIRFSAQMSNNAKKYIETPRKHQQNMFWGFLRNSWKSGSRLSTDFELC